MSFFPENLKLMSSVGADERYAPAISVRNAAAAVALYAIASRDRCRLTGEWLRNTYADTGNPPYSIRSVFESVVIGSEWPPGALDRPRGQSFWPT